MGTFLVVAIVAVAAVLCVCYLCRQKKSGGGCNGNCSQCKGCH